MGTLKASPCLGIVVSQLKNCVEYYNREKRAFDGLKRQRDSLISSLHINQKGKTHNHWSHHIANQWFSTHRHHNFHSTDQRQFDFLTELLHSKQRELKYCIFLTENCLYLLWAHLDFFMLRAISVNSSQFKNAKNNCSANDSKFFMAFVNLFRNI